MPLWKKTTTICAALLISAPFASQSLAQRLSPLTPLPMPSASAAQNVEPQEESIFFDVEPALPQAPIRRQARTYNPLKPMAAPGAPIVKLAERPVFETVTPAKPAASVRQIPAHKVNQAELGRLLALASEPDAEPAEITDAKLMASPEIPMARTATLPTSILTPLPKSAYVATSKTAVGLTNDFPLAATTPSVVVRSPFVQPGNQNRYLFVVENIGTVDAFNTRVDLRVPAGVVLKQVVADSASSTARHAIVRIDELKAGRKAIFPAAMPSTTLETSSVASQVSFKNTESIDTSPVNAGNGSLSASVEGPVLLPAGETGDFAIVVKNPNYGEASSVIVQLAIPEGLKITTLDREAWINDEDNTISWELSSLEARQEETIQYKAVGKSFGQQVQKVTLGMADVYQGDATLVTLVSQ